ncbi:MAG: DNA N-6-adenine-methyltransferase [Nitrososphaerales archaeon]
MTSDNYATPKPFYNILDSEFGFDYDPSPINPTALRAFDGECDGSTTEWKGKSIFVNPPYSDPRPWIENAVKEMHKGKTVVMLLKCDPSTTYFHDLILPHGQIRYIKGRISFNGERAPFPNYIVIFSFKQYPTRTYDINLIDPK